MNRLEPATHRVGRSGWGSRFQAAVGSVVLGLALLCGHTAPGQTNVAVLAEDGAWNWFNDPRALFHQGVLYFGYARHLDGKAVLTAFDPRTGFRTNLWTSTTSERDDFHHPNILVRPDGRMIAVYARHGSEPFFRYRISASTNPVVPEAWGPELRTGNSGAPLLYGNLFQLGEPEGAIFNLVRNHRSNPTLFMSTNGGNTWIRHRVFLESHPASARPYVKLASNGRRVDFVLTEGHPREMTNSLHHVYCEGGLLRDSGGRVLKRFDQLPLVGASNELGSAIYTYSAAPQDNPDEWIPDGRAWCWDVAHDPGGNPTVVFSVARRRTGSGDGSNERIYYYYARWTGTRWLRRMIAHAGRPLYAAEEHYAGGICLDPADPDIVYLSSNATDPFATGNLKDVPLQAQERYELWRGVTRDGGASFAWEPVTFNSPADNLRPVVASGPDGSKALLWFRGRYWSYSAYQCEIAGLFSKPLPQLERPGSRTWSVLTNAAQVRSLSTAEADRNVAVRLRGTVVAEPGSMQHFILQDETAGIYVRGPMNRVAAVRRGDYIEVEGVTDPGEFAPFVSLSSLRKLGTRQIPPPTPVTFEQLISGRLDAQWVEVSGIVRRCEPMMADQKYQMEVATGGGRLTVQIIGRLNPAVLVDAEVRLPGVIFYQVNRSRQLISPLLVVPRGAEFVVEKAAPANPYGMAVLSSASLLQFAPQGAYGHRVHLRGIVTHHAPGETIWIRDDAGGLQVRSSVTNALQPGDLVDLLGFPGRGDYSPLLEDAVFRKSGVGPAPAPVLLTNALQALNHDADLVRMSAVLTARQFTSDGWALVMQSGETLFRTLLRLPPNQPLPEDWQPGSRIELAGIVAVDSDQSGQVAGVAVPRVFQVLLRSPTDLVVIERPPWWTPERVVWVLGGVACVLIAIIAGVVWAAKKRLREQGVQRALAEAEFTAILSERNRMAREIHDTLAQGLSAISMQLEVTKGRLPAGAVEATESVEQAHSLVRSSLTEARNSIWNMRSQVLENNDLPSALDGILHQLTSGTPIRGRVEVLGRRRRLPPVTENNLLRIGQEAITNAVTHAHAARIDLSVEFLEKEVRLTVRDDGCGFDVLHPPKSESGFGLVGMRERAQELQGNLHVHSAAGRGTELSIVVPVTG